MLYNLRDKIKKESRALHSKLDKQYPYSMLMINSDKLDTVVCDFLLCFKLVFESFLSKVKNESTLFSSSYNFFKSFESDILVDESIFLDEIDFLALEYLFLGSRMGNQMILKMNPRLLETIGGEYFGFESGANSLDDFQEKLSSMVLSEEDEKKLVDRVKYYFNQLLRFGLLVEKSKWDSN